MKILFKTLTASLLFLASTQICTAQFDDPPASSTQPQPASTTVTPENSDLIAPTPTQTIKQSNQVFTDIGDGTFKHNKTGLVWLADPTKIPKQNSMEEAKAWMYSNLQNGKSGLSDKSKQGDWRLATAQDWNMASNREKHQLYSNFHIGWPKKDGNGTPEMYSRGYMGIASPGDNWDGKYNLITWGNGGRDGTGWPAYIWPVRSSSVETTMTANPNSDIPVKESYVRTPGKMVFDLNQPLPDGPGRAAYGRSVPLNDSGTGITLSVSINKQENYFTFELVTPGMEGLEGKGVGNRSPIFGYCDDWNFRRQTQTIYATGTGMDAAIQDLQSKLNGATGSLSVTATGDAIKGNAVVTIVVK